MKYSKETSTLLQDAGLDVKNVGSSEAQIALLTDRIRSLTEHVKMHKKDVHSKHGLVKLVSQRKKLLKYLRKTKLDSYDELIKKTIDKRKIKKKMIKVEKNIAGRPLKIESGQIARQAGGSVFISYGETAILATVCCSSEPREGIDFLPMQVEYREKHYAGGKIPGGFFKREAKPTDAEVLTSRLTDRPIRPLIPKNYRHEIQIMLTTMSYDGVNTPDVVAAIGASGHQCHSMVLLLL